MGVGIFLIEGFLEGFSEVSSRRFLEEFLGGVLQAWACRGGQVFFEGVLVPTSRVHRNYTHSQIVLE